MRTSKATDDQIRLGILERELEENRARIEELRLENRRMTKKLKALGASLDHVGNRAEQGHNLVAQLIRRVSKPPA